MTDPRPRGRPRKARVEGAEAAIALPRPDPAPDNNGEVLERIVDYFAAEYPDEWEALRLCPLQHGIDTMAERLK